MNKKYIKISLAAIISIIIIFIVVLGMSRYYAPVKNNIVYSKNLDKKDLDLVISDYIKNNYFNWSNVSSAKKYEAHKIYGVDELFGLKYIYLETIFEAKNDSGTTSGGANPLVIIVKEDSKGEYTVINHKEPRDGDEYGLSLKIFIPQKYLLNMHKIETAEELQKKINFEKRSS